LLSDEEKRANIIGIEDADADILRDNDLFETKDGDILDMTDPQNPVSVYKKSEEQAVLNKRKKASEAAEAKIKEKIFTNTSSLRKEYLAQSKEYQKVRDSFTRVKGSTKDPSPAGDLSLIFNYMKMLDPGSVVRESEFATAANSGSIPQRVYAQYNKALAGERLSPKMRADFVSKAKVLFTGMEKQHEQRIETYKGIAKNNNLPIKDVIVDLSIPEKEIIEITTIEEYNKLPSGAIYLEDGKEYRKP